MTDRQTDRQTKFSSLDSVCISCSAVKTNPFSLFHSSVHLSLSDFVKAVNFFTLTQFRTASWKTFRDGVKCNSSQAWCQRGGSKTQNGHFPSKTALHLKKVGYKLSLCEYCRRQSCKSFIGPSIRPKNVSWGTSPTMRKFGWNWSTPLKMPISNQYSLVAPQP